MLGAGGTALWADRTQRDGGYVTTDVHEFSTSGSALATEQTELGSAGVGWLYSPGLLGKVRIRVTPASPGSALFVGIGRSADVDRYLAGVEPHRDLRVLRGQGRGGRRRLCPVRSRKRSTSGSPPHRPRAADRRVGADDGSWTVVVMNADGRPGIDVERRPRSPHPGAALDRGRRAASQARSSRPAAALLIAGAFPRNRTPPIERKV